MIGSLLPCTSLVVAQMRSADRVRKCLLFGVDRTYRGHHETDAIDPFRTSVKKGQRTLGSPIFCRKWPS
jgi:hypothetical protein